MIKRLNSNGVMEKTDKSKILSGVYDFVTTLVLYPSPSQYNEMAMAIFKKMVSNSSRVVNGKC